VNTHQTQLDPRLEPGAKEQQVRSSPTCSSVTRQETGHPAHTCMNCGGLAQLYPCGWRCAQHAPESVQAAIPAAVDGYASACPVYLARGWAGILPLPPAQKGPPPRDATGMGNPDPTVEILRMWASRYQRWNTGLRLPTSVLGIDVDAYKPEGAESWSRLLAELGPLPDTWSSTSRGDGSGIRLFRVPAGIRWAERQAGPGIELIHHTHRYIVVWPSIHPSGAKYRWLGPEGQPIGRVPSVAELPALPAVWGRRLSVSPVRTPVWAPVARTGSAPGYAGACLDGVCRDLAQLGPGSGRNNALFFAALRLGRLVVEDRLSEVEVTDALVDAADRNGHTDKHGPRRTLRTIESGLNAARTSHRTG
jgi:hypothetical protein